MKTKNHTHFFALLKLMGISNDDRRDFILDYSDGLTGSLSELAESYPGMYKKMITDMRYMVRQIQSNGDDKLRKRVIAAIGGYLQLTGQDADIRYIKAIACRATGYESFNAIPTERLRNVYNAFVKQQNDFKAVGELNRDRLKKLTVMN